MTPSDAKKDITIINIIKIAQNITDLRTLHKKMFVGLSFFVYPKMQEIKKYLAFSF